MVEKERGDLWGYSRVKQEITSMIEGLSGGSLFNIYAFDNILETFRPSPVPATSENKTAAAAWIECF